MPVTSVNNAFITSNKLKDHEKLKLERVKYACYKCDDAFTTRNKLKDHDKLKHERVKYECDTCDVVVF